MNLPSGPRWLAPAACGAAALAAIAGLGWHLEPTPDLADRLRDDAFYEFLWAHNVATGRGPVVSDGTTTSGVQLLWSLLLVPVAWLVDARALPAVAAWLGFALHTATAALWWLRTRDRVTGACIALCWLGHPLLVRESQNGQETALACLCLTVTWLVRRRGLGVFCVSALLTVLARSELAVFVLALSFWRDGFANARAWVAPALALGVHAAANRLLGGGWLPDSALPMAWLWHANFARLGGGAIDWLAQSWWYARPVLLGAPWAHVSAMGCGFLVFTAVRGIWPASLRALPALLVGGASALGARDLVTAGWAALLLALFPAQRRRRVARRWLALAGAAAAVVALHWAVRWYPRDYYVAPLVVTAVAAVRAFGRWRLLLLVFALAQVADVGRTRPEPLQAQREMQLAGEWLDEVLPAGARVGCFNSGIVAWYAATRAGAAGDRPRIVNLDGVVDARAFAALRERRLAAWLDAQHVDHLLDNPVQFALDPRLPHASGHWFGDGFAPARDLVEIARFDVLGVDNGRPGGDSLRLYWRRGRGEPPARDATAAVLGQDDRYVLVRWPAARGDVLEVESAGGQRRALLSVDHATVVHFAAPREALGTGRLFVRGRPAPVLTLRTL